MPEHVLESLVKVKQPFSESDGRRQTEKQGKPTVDECLERIVTDGDLNATYKSLGVVAFQCFKTSKPSCLHCIPLNALIKEESRGEHMQPLLAAMGRNITSN